MIGFETIGNATVTVFDDIPVLTTDPWIDGKPYFGSWAHQRKFLKNNMKISLNQNMFGFLMGTWIILITSL